MTWADAESAVAVGGAAGRAAEGRAAEGGEAEGAKGGWEAQPAVNSTVAIPASRHRRISMGLASATKDKRESKNQKYQKWFYVYDESRFGINFGG